MAEHGHLPALRHLPDANIIALADVNPGRLTRLAERFHIKNRYADFRALVSDPAVEAIAVCVPPQFHVQVALAGLDAGKHWFLEKPLALDLNASDPLGERASRSPANTMVGFDLRWYRPAQHACAIIREETFGAIELVRTVDKGIAFPFLSCALTALSLFRVRVFQARCGPGCGPPLTR